MPQWLNMVKSIIRKYNSEADIVLWSYNWARQEEKYRIELIDNLPADVSLLATYSRPDIVEFEGVKTMLADYTLSFEGPSNYFLSEAKAAYLYRRPHMGFWSDSLRTVSISVGKTV